MKAAGVLGLVNLLTHQRMEVESVECMAGKMCNLFVFQSKSENQTVNPA